MSKRKFQTSPESLTVGCDSINKEASGPTDSKANGLESSMTSVL